MSDPTILVVGADGTIGRALLQRIERIGSAVVATTRRRQAVGRGRYYLDLSTGSRIEGLDRPVAAAHIAAAVARLPACAKDPAGSRAVNVTHTAALVRQLAADGTHVLYLSTDKVFDGSKSIRPADDPWSPATEYGRQKAAAEREILALDRTAVLRLTKVLGTGDPLLAGWRRDLLAGKPIAPFHDMQMAPVPIDLVLETMLRISETRATGIFQLSGSRDVSYAEAARYLAERLGVSLELVRPIATNTAGLALEAPARFTALASERVERAFGIRAPDVLGTIAAASMPVEERSG
ncbi:MAG: sugar nucleotide-binding protein [Proteobacteria bacterium]|nr:sugar nucleotide-binding protein [Pseudomonadota bacterium]